jgi:hypothetical protein
VDARVVTAQPALVAFVHRWRAALARMALPAAAFAVAMSMVQVPFNLRGGLRGWELVLGSAVGPLLQAALMGIFAAMVDAAGWQGRQRTSAMIAAAFFGSAIGVNLEGFAIHDAVFASSPLSQFVLMWGNIGMPMALCTGAVLAYDHHLRARRRATALRGLRMRAATAGRRAAMVRLQALQARIDPRFLFETLEAVERDYEEDLALGDRLLDRLIAGCAQCCPICTMPRRRSVASSIVRRCGRTFGPRSVASHSRSRSRRTATCARRAFPR